MQEYLIVGGGIYGTCIARWLLETEGLTHDDITIIDPHDELLASFEGKAAACGMEYLRSPYVQHIGTKSFGMRKYAEEHGRIDELVSTHGNPRRPSVGLFFDYARRVIEENGLEAMHHQARATDICRDSGHLVVETDAGNHHGERVVLAIGHGGAYDVPEWAADLPDEAPVHHVWEEGYDESRVKSYDGETYVIGGGITAGQVALDLGDAGVEVTLLSRSSLQVEAIECDPQWIGWSYIQDHLHRLPSGSAARQRLVNDERFDGTVPPYLMDDLREAGEEGLLTREIGEVRTARDTEGRIVLSLENGSVRTNVQVVLATGFADIRTHPLVERITAIPCLTIGDEGMPVLDDETLEWIPADGYSGSNVYVVGALATSVIGPFAYNIAGAKRAAERLVDDDNGQ